MANEIVGSRAIDGILRSISEFQRTYDQSVTEFPQIRTIRCEPKHRQFRQNRTQYPNHFWDDAKTQQVLKVRIRGLSGRPSRSIFLL